MLVYKIVNEKFWTYLVGAIFAMESGHFRRDDFIL